MEEKQIDLKTDLKKLKVVILHDWLTGLRGGERVLEKIIELFPSSPIYTLVYHPGSVSDLIEKQKIVSSIINKLPGVHNYYRKLLPLFPWVAENISVPDDTDLIISSSHCAIKAVKKPKKRKNIPHISYIHSPMRYIYDQFDAYFGVDSGARPLEKIMGHLIRRPLQKWDLNSNKEIDTLVANSHFVRKRIEKYYHREALVVHPFVEISDFQKVQSSLSSSSSLFPKQNYFLLLSAFAPNKRVDLAITAWRKLKAELRASSANSADSADKELVLKIVGSGQQEKHLKQLAYNQNPFPKDIQFLGSLARTQIIELLAGARALIFPGVEDFGIVPLEALAAGTPVVAFQGGGVLETLTSEVAVFFPQLTADSLYLALKEFLKQQKDGKFLDPKAMFKRGNEFSPQRFKQEFLKIVQTSLAARGA